MAQLKSQEQRLFAQQELLNYLEIILNLEAVLSARKALQELSTLFTQGL